MSRRPGETGKDWYLRVRAERAAADAKSRSAVGDSSSSRPVDTHSPAQDAAMARLEGLRAEFIEAEAAMINEEHADQR